MQEMYNALAQPWEDNETPCWTSFQQVVYNTARAYLDKHDKSVADKKHQIQEKCIEQDRPLYIVFVNFSRAFDTVRGLDCGSC